MFNGYKTYIGIIIAVAPTLASLFGYDLSPVFGQEFAEIVTEVLTIVGAGVAAYGRLKAQAPGWLAKK